MVLFWIKDTFDTKSPVAPPLQVAAATGRFSSQSTIQSPGNSYYDKYYTKRCLRYPTPQASPKNSPKNSPATSCENFNLKMLQDMQSPEGSVIIRKNYRLNQGDNDIDLLNLYGSSSATTGVISTNKRYQTNQNSIGSSINNENHDNCQQEQAAKTKRSKTLRSVRSWFSRKREPVAPQEASWKQEESNNKVDIQQLAKNVFTSSDSGGSSSTEYNDDLLAKLSSGSPNGNSLKQEDDCVTAVNACDTSSSNCHNDVQERRDQMQQESLHDTMPPPKRYISGVNVMRHNNNKATMPDLKRQNSLRRLLTFKRGNEEKPGLSRKKSTVFKRAFTLRRRQSNLRDANIQKTNDNVEKLWGKNEKSNNQQQDKTTENSNLISAGNISINYNDLEKLDPYNLNGLSFTQESEDISADLGGISGMNGNEYEYGNGHGHGHGDDSLGNISMGDTTRETLTERYFGNERVLSADLKAIPFDLTLEESKKPLMYKLKMKMVHSKESLCSRIAFDSMRSKNDGDVDISKDGLDNWNPYELAKHSLTLGGGNSCLNNNDNDAIKLQDTTDKMGNHEVGMGEEDYSSSSCYRDLRLDADEQAPAMTAVVTEAGSEVMVR